MIYHHVWKTWASPKVYREFQEMAHRASLASLKKLSSESNNGGREDCCPLKARLCVASGAFFCHVLRILMSEFNEDLKEPSSGDSQSFPCFYKEAKLGLINII